ncbi:WAT1-related protein At2g39510-like [Olea europaea var. sylvestris]|uniref:WAT1-related protein At2g39510-like n=1 Tax=Olea europaea var. sylvestris TaxID=158386 RepID=UPI000C1D3D0B|nr:WAT1-related protein At2g39510-like [Olea europaea var. sylvestris]
MQAKTLESYPALLSLTAMICAAMGVEGFIASVVLEKGINFAVWSIHWDIKLLAYVYGGILCSGLGNYISLHILREKGPVFLTSFNPLTMLIVAGMSSFILAEQLELGKVVGGFVIVVGLYLVLWGKTKDDHNSSSTGLTEEKPSIHHQIYALDSPTVKALSIDGSQATTTEIV